MFGPTPPPRSADELAAEAAYGALTAQQQIDLSPYIYLFRSIPGIAESMGYATLSPSNQAGVWAAIEQAESDGGPGYAGAISPPADYPVDPFSTVGGTDIVDYTEAEATTTYCAKVAHALKLEVDRTLPWRLADYYVEELSELFDPTKVFRTWDHAPEWATQDEICDHSPSIAYALASTNIVGAETTTWAVGMLIENIGRQFIHSYASDPTWVVHLDDAMVDKISRGGCHFAAPLIQALCRALNIPSTLIDGGVTSGQSWFAGAGHGSLAFPGVGRGFMLAHADHIYTGSLGPKGPNYARELNLYRDWVDQVFIHESGSLEARQSTLRLTALKLADRPHSGIVADFENSNEGWSSVWGLVGAYLNFPEDQAAYDRLYAYLARHTGGDGAGPEWGALNINKETPWTNASCEITPNPRTGLDSQLYGAGRYTSAALAGTYTVTWLDDNYPGNIPPPPEVVVVTDQSNTEVVAPIYNQTDTNHLRDQLAHRCGLGPHTGPSHEDGEFGGHRDVPEHVSLCWGVLPCLAR